MFRDVFQQIYANYDLKSDSQSLWNHPMIYQ